MCISKLKTEDIFPNSKNTFNLKKITTPMNSEILQIDLGSLRKKREAFEDQSRHGFARFETSIFG